MPDTELLTTSQVAMKANVSVRTVVRWVESGQLPVAQRLPGKTGALLFDPSDVDRVLVPVSTLRPAPSGHQGPEAA